MTMPVTPVFTFIDVAVAAALLYAAAEAFRCWLLLRDGGSSGPAATARYWRLAALGLAALALDELLGLHEAIGWAIASLGAPAPWHTSHWDDVVLAGYVLLAAAISIGHLGALRRSPRAFALLALGFGVAALAVLLDNLAHAPAVEEPLELAGAALIATALRVRRVEAAAIRGARRSSAVRPGEGAEVVPG
ncbi:MAG: hypothetical protein F4X76_02690 [Chloroflexi bacterium]|nr:hypothetical protein [Chloroflexota bacterium]